MPSFIVSGADFPAGNPDGPEPFRVTVIADDARAALGLVYRLRVREGREYPAGLTAVESISPADVQTFIAEAHEGVSDPLARAALEQLRRISDQLGELDERSCSTPRTQTREAMDAAEEARLELQARTLALAFGMEIIRQSDPRGRALAIATPRSRRFNGMGGAECGWCI